MTIAAEQSGSRRLLRALTALDLGGCTGDGRHVRNLLAGIAGKAGHSF